MAEKVTYKEPKSYFSPGMKKVASEWEKQNKASKTSKTSAKKSK